MQRLGLLALVLFLTTGVSTSLPDEKITVSVEATDDDSSSAVNYISEALRPVKGVEVVNDESLPVFKLQVSTLPMINEQDGSVMAYIISSIALRRHDGLDKYLKEGLSEQDRIAAISSAYVYIRNYLSYCHPDRLQEVCETQVTHFDWEYLSRERQFRGRKLNVDERADDFVKLDAPLKEVLTQVVFELTVLSGDFKVEVVFDNTYRADDGYVLLPQYAVEGNRYIFVPLYQGGGGSGVFYDLCVVDKKTLRGIDEVGLGDRTRIKEVTLVPSDSDVVSITYIRRTPRKAKLYDLNAAIEKTFHVIKGKLQEMSQEK
jgi:hypothetical protein